VEVGTAGKARGLGYEPHRIEREGKAQRY